MLGLVRSRKVLLAAMCCGLTALTAAFAAAPQQRGDPPDRVPPKSVPPGVGGDKQAQLDQAKEMHAQATKLKEAGKFAEAEPLFRKTAEICLQFLGEFDFNTAYCIYCHAEALRGMGKYKESEALDRKALAIFERVEGDGKADIAYCITALAEDLYHQGRYEEAETLDRKALAIRQKHLGENDLVTALSYNNLSADLHFQEKFTDAESFGRKALEIRLRLLGKDHAYTANSFANLSLALAGMGDFAAAEKNAREALQIREKLFPPDHPDIAASFHDLADVLADRGEYAAAEMMHRKALEMRRKKLGEFHLSTAQSFNTLGNVLHLQSQFRAAEMFHRKALEIREKVFPEGNAITATSMNNLALDLHRQGQHGEAEKLTRKVLEINLKVFGEMNRHTAVAYNNLAANVRSLGDLDQAEKLDRKALEIRQKVLGEQHSQTAESYNNLAADFQLQGDFAEAEKLFGKALAIYRKALGEDHPATTRSMDNLAQVCAALGDYEKAEKLAAAAVKDFQSSRLKSSFTGIGRSTFTSNRSPLLFLTALLARNGKPAEAWMMLEEGLGRGLLDDLTAKATRKLSPQDQNQLKTLLTQLADIDRLIQADKKITVDEHAKLHQKKENLLAQLVEFQANLAKKNGVASGNIYDLTRVQQSLPGDTALITWVDIDGTAKSKDPDGEHWGVVLRNQGTPIWVRLRGTGAEGGWKGKFDDFPLKLRKIFMGGNPNEDWKSWRDDLTKQRLRPFFEHLEGVKHLVVLPSEAMRGIPIEALTDRFPLVSYAPSATLFAWLQENRAQSATLTGLLAIADPVFSQEQAKAASKEHDIMASLLRGELKALPGTRGEAKAIAGLFEAKQVALYLGNNAKTATIDSLASKNQLAQFRYVHFATHGIFDMQNGLNSYVAMTPDDLSVAAHGKLTANHMMHTWQLNADLVTLSACTTALGQYQGGEGYVGFSQALFLAGAHTVVLSQWPVHDFSTTLLMERFYQNLLGKREGLKTPLSKVEALSEARKWLRELKRDGAVKRLQELGIQVDPKTLTGARPFEHPYYWAPFILIGDPGLAGAGQKRR